LGISAAEEALEADELGMLDTAIEKYSQVISHFSQAQKRKDLYFLSL
jgi:hypothetical protein